MKIFVNGAASEVSATELEAAVRELGYGEQVVATACNGEFVPVSQRAATLLREGDRLEVLAPMQGG